MDKIDCRDRQMPKRKGYVRLRDTRLN